jgi:hypothetical protein
MLQKQSLTYVECFTEDNWHRHRNQSISSQQRSQKKVDLQVILAVDQIFFVGDENDQRGTEPTVDFAIHVYKGYGFSQWIKY